MNDQRFYSLKELKTAAELSCLAARRAWYNDRIDGAAAWERINCIEAREWRNEHGERGYTVVIDESSPDNIDLQEFVEADLKLRGFEDVEVETIW